MKEHSDEEVAVILSFMQQMILNGNRIDLIDRVVFFSDEYTIRDPTWPAISSSHTMFFKEYGSYKFGLPIELKPIKKFTVTYDTLNMYWELSQI